MFTKKWCRVLNAEAQDGGIYHQAQAEDWSNCFNVGLLTTSGLMKIVDRLAFLVWLSIAASQNGSLPPR